MTECHEVCDDRMTECHEVCDDSAFMPTKEFLQKRLCRQRSSLKSVYADKGVPSKAFMPTKEFPYESIFREAQYLLRYLVGSEYAKNR